MLAILIMFTKCERVFSSAKHLFTNTRNYLNLNIIKANECLRHWFGKPEEDEADQGAKESKEATIKAMEESDIEDDIVYKVDSDNEIVWKDD